MGSRRKHRRRGFLGALVLAGVLSAAAYGYMASNTIASGGTVGYGSASVSGYTVTNPSYTFDTTTPDYSKVTAVTFTLSAAATTVAAQVVSTGGSWYTCSNTSGNNWSCTISPSVTAASIDQLAVSATS